MMSLHPPLHFSYKQFLVYDQNVELPGCEWTEEHVAQGFARRESVACFSTLLESGHADVHMIASAYQSSDKHERAIAVPFMVVSGRVVVEGPEETGAGRVCTLSIGPYRLVAAQCFVSEERETIELFFEKMTCLPEHSQILVADSQIFPCGALIETSEIAGGG